MDTFVTIEGRDLYIKGLSFIKDHKFREAFDCFSTLCKMKDEDTKIKNLSNTYMKNLATIVTTIKTLNENLSKDPILKGKTRTMQMLNESLYKNLILA